MDEFAKTKEMAAVKIKEHSRIEVSNPNKVGVSTAASKDAMKPVLAVSKSEPSTMETNSVAAEDSESKTVADHLEE